MELRDKQGKKSWEDSRALSEGRRPVRELRRCWERFLKKFESKVEKFLYGYCTLPTAGCMTMKI